jgi:hypothetical protein
MPNVSVFDRDGLLPVNLQRTSLQGKLPFREELLRSVGEDLVAHALAEAPDHCEAPWFDGAYEGFFLRSRYTLHTDWAKWLIGRDGFVLNEPYLIATFRPRVLLVAIGGQAGYVDWGEKLRAFLPPDVLVASFLPGILSHTNPRIKGMFRSAVEGSIYPSGAKPTRYATYIPNALIEKIKTLRPGRHIARYLAQLDASDEQNEWKCLQWGPEPWLTEAVTSLSTHQENPTVFCAMQLEGIRF